MSILDDAIREHLELKRAHGADDSELKRLEDEAFGPPQRPDEADPFAEAPTEFLVSPSETPASLPEIEDDTTRSGRRPDIADLQEAPPAPPAEDDAPAEGAPTPIPGQEELLPAPDAPPPSPADAAEESPPPPAEEFAPSAGEEIAPDRGPDAEERHAIADQPTQMFDVQAHVDAEATEAPPEGNVAPPTGTGEGAGEGAEAPEQEPLDLRGPDAEVAGHPPAEPAPTEEESAEFDFFNEQRLSDELDQALEAPLPPTDEHIAMPRHGDAVPSQPGVFDFETEDRYEEDPSEEALRRHDAPEPPSEEHEAPSDEYDPPSEESPRASAEPPSEELDAFDPDTGHEDVLEDTPTFLEDAPEDDDLWFEQKPPKDFDL